MVPTGWGECSHAVPLDDFPPTILHWSTLVAVGLVSSNIINLETTTGSPMTTFPGHWDWVESITFSSNGILLVSGNFDKTVQLWDVQTGETIRTFFGHKSRVQSVSILADSTIIASGSDDKSVHLWDTHTGECLHILEHYGKVSTVCFSNADAQELVCIHGLGCELEYQQQRSWKTMWGF